MERVVGWRGGWVARWLGLAVALTGFGTLASCLLPQWRDRLQAVNEVFTPELTGVASGLAALAGVTLVLVGRGVAGRRRVAWLVAVVALGAATVAHIVKDLDLETASATAAGTGVLLWQRRLFVVGPSPAQWSRVLRVALVALGVDLAYGILGLWLHRHVIAPDLTPGNVLAEVAAALVGLPGPLTVEGQFGHWFPASLTALGGLTLVATFSVIFAPIALAGGADDRFLGEAGALTDRADGDTLDPFVLRRDKRRVFSPDRRAVLGYRYVRGVGLAAGDPVGDPAAFVAVLQEFLALCVRLGWRPALIGVREDRLPLYADLGLRTLYIGDEALIDVAGFTLTGRRMRNARQAVARTRNAAVTTEFHWEGELDRDLRESLLRVSEIQRGTAREFGFSMTLGGLFTGDHPGCLIAVARDRTGRPIAFQRYLPCRNGKALSLDIMRRLPTAPNGVNERLIVETVEWARAREVDAVSLNFAAFRSLLDDDAPSSPIRDVSAWLLQSFDGRLGLQLDTLRRFNGKFAPTWIRRYLVYQAHSHIPAVGVAALSAEGFLPLDPNREEADGGYRPAATASRRPWPAS